MFGKDTSYFLAATPCLPSDHWTYHCYKSLFYWILSLYHPYLDHNENPWIDVSELEIVFGPMVITVCLFISLLASPPFMGREASRARTRERAAKPRGSRAVLVWLLAIPPNGELARRLFVYEFWMLFYSGFESSRKRTQSTATRDLYDSTEETDSQLQWTDATGWYKLHGNVRWFNLTTKHSKQLVIASFFSTRCYCLRECWVCFSFFDSFSWSTSTPVSIKSQPWMVWRFVKFHSSSTAKIVDWIAPPSSKQPVQKTLR